MDHNAIVDEILRRVSEKLSEAAEGAETQSGKPGLLVLTQEHGTSCHALLESEALKGHYRTECALLQNYEVNLDDFEVVVLFHLTCDALSRLASGICETPYDRLASKAILSGKRVYIPTEEVELYQYKQTAPAAYFGMLQQKLDLLVASGVVICAGGSLEQVILGASAPAPEPAAATASAPSSSVAPAAPAPADKEERLDKRVLTEKDLIEANMEGITLIRVGSRCILTALAVDAAKDRGVTIVKDED